ncbi:MAG TPA: alpha-ketoglutarate-dependent dioxygenase AlkB [Thermomicrobiales bacterium]|nr:alpha-ketoglutarate-dependent dioxygenase AlkB [Thermomicrobiales bacterium]
MRQRTWTLIGTDGRPYQSDRPGTFGGHRKTRLYGRLDCPGALRAIARGGYVSNRVFFLDEATAIAAGYRPCAVCMPERYRVWKRDPRSFREAMMDLEHTNEMESLFPRERREVMPGAIHFPDWLSIEEQRRIVGAWREWAAGPAPMRALTLPSGGVMSVKMVCLGWQWLPYKYTKTAEIVGGAPVPPVPDWLVGLGRRAVADAYDDPAQAAAYVPDAALVNFYDNTAKMGMHRDKDERSDAPVVSFSIGDSCIFRFGNTTNRNKPYTDIELRSGDLFVFGGPARFAYHGVTKILPGTAPPETGLPDGRLNITLRVTGLSEPMVSPPTKGHR